MQRIIVPLFLVLIGSTWIGAEEQPEATLYKQPFLRLLRRPCRPSAGKWLQGYGGAARQHVAHQEKISRPAGI